MKKFGVFLLALGILLGLGAGGWMLYNERDDERAGKEAADALSHLLPIIADRHAGKSPGGAEPAEGAAPDQAMDVVVIDGYAYIGYLSVPEIGLDLPVQADWTMELLEKSPARYSGNLAQGDLIILGHNYKRHFTPLKRLAAGARVAFTDVNGVEYGYVVSEVTTVGGYDEQGMLSGSDSWDLTLFTCTYGGRDRLTLRCVLQGIKN